MDATYGVYVAAESKTYNNNNNTAIASSRRFTKCIYRSPRRTFVLMWVFLIYNRARDYELRAPFTTEYFLLNRYNLT